MTSRSVRIDTVNMVDEDSRDCGELVLKPRSDCRHGVVHKSRRFHEN